jgi:hypothetical protein
MRILQCFKVAHGRVECSAVQFIRDIQNVASHVCKTLALQLTRILPPSPSPLPNLPPGPRRRRSLPMIWQWMQSVAPHLHPHVPLESPWTRLGRCSVCGSLRRWVSAGWWGGGRIRCIGVVACFLPAKAHAHPHTCRLMVTFWACLPSLSPSLRLPCCRARACQVQRITRHLQGPAVRPSCLPCSSHTHTHTHARARAHTAAHVQAPSPTHISIATQAEARNLHLPRTPCVT